MPRGEAQARKRRGKYGARGAKKEMDAIVDEMRASEKFFVGILPGQPVDVPAPLAPAKHRVEFVFGLADKQVQLVIELPAHWLAEDVGHFSQCMRESKIKKLSEREHAARMATTIDRQIRALDATVGRTVEEEKTLVSAAAQYRKYRFEVLGNAEKSDDEDEEL